MKRTIYQNRCLASCLAIVAMLMMSLGVKAQDVDIAPQWGSVVTSVSSADDSGFILGLGALWRHQQLALSMTGTDRDAINASGEISQPSTVIGEYNGMLTLVGGRRPSFLVVSLPKGYRITGYDLVLVNNLIGVDYAPGKNTGSGHNGFHHLNGNQNDNELYGQAVSNGYGTMRFYETTQWEVDGTNSPATQSKYTDNNVRLIEPAEIGSTILATAANGTDINIDANDADNGKEFTISRHNIEGANQLYFRLVKNFTHYGISIKSFKIYFTAEGTFDAPSKPSDVDHARRVVSYSFPTNKIDIGKMQMLSQEGHEGEADYTFFSYNFRNVTDLNAYTYIYQEKAVKDGVPYERETDDQGNSITPHIYPVQFGTGENAERMFAFENDVYYVEPPTTIHTSSGLEAPIGYRIVGAKIEYLWKDETNITKTIPDGFYIEYDRVTTTSSGATTTRYYLGNNLQFTQTNNPTVWHMDDKGNIYYSASDLRYLSCNGEEDIRTLSWSRDANSRFNLRTEDGNKIYYYSDGLNYYNLQAVVNASGVPSGAQVVKDALNNLPYSQYQAGGHTVTTCEYSPGTYTLNIWDQKTGETIDASKSVEVTEAKAKSDENYVELKDLNNDAIKFSISGLSSGKKALLLITLQLQALDPYINNMLVECKNLPKELQMSQTFTASNFAVSGGSFIFYVPSDLAGETMDISFSDLYSNYGDKTYWGETESLTNARYSFVSSDYFKQYSGNQKTTEQLIALGMDAEEAAKWPVNGGLYDEDYTPDTDYRNKVTTATAGNVRYKFNNAEDLSNDIDVEEGTEYSAYLEEFPFSVTKYLSNYPDPDAAAGTTPTKAKFAKCQVIAGDGTQNAGSFFVFTADETRYNIAPTTDWQHRFYAFYRMDVKAVAKSYSPALEWTKVYNSALYVTEDEDGKEVKGEEAQFGLMLKTKEILDNGQIGDFTKGYLTVKEINDAIAAAITAEKANPTGDVPTSRDQILYIDGSGLIGIYNYIKTQDGQPIPATLEDLMDGLGTNALIYLPKSISTKLDNFASFEPDINSFRAAKDIVLTDKQPFYSKYDIQIDPANTVTYERKISDALNGQAKLATIMLPFTLTVDKTNGLHTNPSETPVCTFTVNKMLAGAEMSLEGNSVNHGTAFFGPLKETTTEANTPYMIEVKSTSAATTDDFSFIIAEKGAKIIATNIDGEDNPNGTGWLHTGEEDVNATFGNYAYTFTNKATFSGAKFDRAAKDNSGKEVGEDVFYFAGNQYLDLHTLVMYQDGIHDAAHLNQYLYIYPFRGVYTYTKTLKPGTTGAKLYSFDISFDEYVKNFGIATDLDKTGTTPDLMIRSGRGMLTITASRSQDVVIRSVNGMVVKNTNVEAGNTTTVALPAGIYVVNNTKITVK